MIATPERRTQCIRIEPANGDPVRIVIAYPVDLIMSNDEAYRGGIYSQPTDINSTVSGGPTVIDLGSVYEADTITQDQVQSGYWDGARAYSFFTDWAYPVEDEEPDHVYTFGKVREQDDRYVVEMLSIMDLLGQTTGRVITPGCTYVLGDEHVDGTTIPSDRSRCKVSPLLVANISSSVTDVINPMQLVSAGLSGMYPDDFFGFGEIVFTSGNNAGLSFKFVKSYTADGTITLAQPFYFPIGIDDLFDIRPGCRKRFSEDCIAKYSNGIHFGAFPHVPQGSTVIKFGDQ